MNKKSIYNLPEFDITIITLAEVFEKIQIHVLNNIFPIFNNNYIIFSSDVKRYFLHFLIKDVCDYFNQCFYKNKILLVEPSFVDNNLEIWQHLNKDIVQKFILDCFETLKNILPFPVYITNDYINLSDNNGETKDCIFKLIQIHNNFVNKSITTKRLRKYSTKKGLTYITNTYIVSTDFKKLLYNT